MDRLAPDRRRDAQGAEPGIPRQSRRARRRLHPESRQVRPDQRRGGDGRRRRFRDCLAERDRRIAGFRQRFRHLRSAVHADRPDGSRARCLRAGDHGQGRRIPRQYEDHRPAGRSLDRHGRRRQFHNRLVVHLAGHQLLQQRPRAAVHARRRADRRRVPREHGRHADSQRSVRGHEPRRQHRDHLEHGPGDHREDLRLQGDPDRRTVQRRLRRQPLHGV